ncbi:hypothetical protein Ciccas_010655 [Cichlidogyrus casuarinus]|uniref:Uncharacterized protein n=1 Tax=Cichlidogyrus casuarinus TaxID=1844966 RepID=A0ABD2PUP9_9PLAT
MDSNATTFWQNHNEAILEQEKYLRDALERIKQLNSERIAIFPKLSEFYKVDHLHDILKTEVNLIQAQDCVKRFSHLV